MKHGKRRLLGALLAGASVMGIVAPAVNAMAATIDDETNATAEELKAVIGEYSAKLDKDHNFANYHRVKYAAERLSKYDEAKSQEVIASISKYDKEVFTSDVVKIVDKMDSFAQTKKTQLFDELLQTDIPALGKTDGENADYLKGRLDVWGQALVFAADPEYSKATDAIMQVKELREAGKSDEALDQVAEAKELIKAIKTYEVNGAYLEAKLKIEEDAVNDLVKAPLKVSSIKAVDAARIQITFNKDIDWHWSEVNGNCSLYIDGKEKTENISYCENPEGNIVNVFLDSEKYLENGQSFKVDVKDLVDSSYVKMEPYKGEYKIFDDNEAPQLIDTNYTGSKIEFTFNEYLTSSSKPTIKIDNKTVDKKKIESGESDCVTVWLDDKDDNFNELGDHEVTISGVTDCVDNVSDMIKTKYSVTEESEKPKVDSITRSSDNQVRVNFNTDVVQIDKNNLLDYVEISKGNHKFSNDDLALVKGGTSNVDQWRINFKPSAYSGETNCLFEDGETQAELTVKVKDYKTTANVSGDEFVGKVTMKKDASDPMILADSLNRVFNNKLVVVFNENLSRVEEYVDKSKITVTRDGIKEEVVNAYVDPDDDAFRLKIDLKSAEDGQLQGGQYKITFEKGAVKDNSGNNNKNEAQTTTIDYTSEKGSFFTLTSNAVKVNEEVPEWSKDKNVIRVRYDKKMTNSALELSNYKVHGIKLSNSDFAGTSIAFTNENKKDEVEITLAKGNINSDNESCDLILSQNIMATDGSYLVGGKDGVADDDRDYTNTVVLDDDTAPELDNVEFIKDKSDDKTSNTLKVTFTEDIKLLKDKDVIKDFKVKNGDDTIDVESVTKGSEDDTLIIKLNKKINVNTNGKVTVQITDKHEDNPDDINIIDANKFKNAVEATDPIKVTDFIVEGEYNKLPEAKIEYKANDATDTSAMVTGVSKDKIVTTEANLTLTRNFDNVNESGISLTKNNGTPVTGVTLDSLKTTGFKLGKTDHSEDGSYVFTVIDKYDNKTSVEFTIDTTDPVVGLKQNSIDLVINDNKCTANQNDLISLDVTNDTDVVVKFKAPGGDSKEETLEKTEKGYVILQEEGKYLVGDYTLTVTDLAGNITTITITVA